MLLAIMRMSFENSNQCHTLLSKARATLEDMVSQKHLVIRGRPSFPLWQVETTTDGIPSEICGWLRASWSP